MMHGPWNIKCKGQSFLSFWAIFSLLTLLTTQNIKILKKWKKPWRYYHFTLVYHKWKSYDVWFLRQGAQQTEFLVILGYFLSFTPCPLPPTRSPSLTTQIIKTLKKSKKHLQISFGYLQICADMVRDGCNCYFSFWAILFLFTPLTAQKNEKFKKMKNRSWDIIIVPKIIIICYTAPEIWRVTDVIAIFHFGLFFALLPQISG